MAWMELVEAVATPGQASELRGMCIRRLERAPHHPGLLLTRALAEALCTDHDITVSAAGIADAITRGRARYGLTEEEWEAAVGRICDLAADGRSALASPLALALVRLGDAGDDSGSDRFLVALRKRVRDMDVPELHRLLYAEDLRRLSLRGEAVLGRLSRALNAPEVSRALEGEPDGR